MEKKFKAVLRIPTQRQYAYIEIIVEGTPDEIVADYLKITSAYKKAQREWDEKESKEEEPPY